MELCQTALLSLSLSQTSKFITTNKSQAASFEAEIHQLKLIYYISDGVLQKTLAEKISGQLQVLQILFASECNQTLQNADGWDFPKSYSLILKKTKQLKQFQPALVTHNQSVAFQSWLKREVAAGSNPRKNTEEAATTAKDAGSDAAPVAVLSEGCFTFSFLAFLFMSTLKWDVSTAQKVLYNNSLQSSTLKSPVGRVCCLKS